MWNYYFNAPVCVCVRVRVTECDPELCESDVPSCRDDQTLIATRADGSCCLAHICSQFKYSLNWLFCVTFSHQWQTDVISVLSELCVFCSVFFLCGDASRLPGWRGADSGRKHHRPLLPRLPVWSDNTHTCSFIHPLFIFYIYRLLFELSKNIIFIANYVSVIHMIIVIQFYCCFIAFLPFTLFSNLLRPLVSSGSCPTLITSSDA